MNIFDYLTWRGDLSFKQDPFNEVDNLIVCELAYIRFDKYFKNNERYTIKQLDELYFKDNSLEESHKEVGLMAGSSLILKAMANTNRFKDCVVFNYVYKFDNETKEQFGALELDLKDGTTYIAFEGTDDTLVGWHEDFMLSYTKTKAQDEAYNYLKKAIKPFHKYRIGGHSKGGNLAAYASLLLANKHKNIINIYSNDGPGLNYEFLPSDYRKSYDLIKDKYVKYMPEFDLFGEVYNIGLNNIIIKSSSSGILQHSGYSWLVEGNHFVRGKESEDSLLIREAFMEFFNSVDIKQRKEFVDELFIALEKAGIKNISDLSSGGFGIIAQAIKNIAYMNETSKKVANKIIKLFTDKYVDSFSKEVIEFKDYVKKQTYSIVDTIKKNIVGMK